MSPKVSDCCDEEQLVKDYLTQSNRPYSSNDILANLKKAVGKTQLLKILEKLTSNETIVEKVYGKAKVYLINQKLLKKVDSSEMSKLNEELNSKIFLNQNLKEELKTISAKLFSFRQIKTDEQLEKEIGDLEKEILAKSIELKDLKSKTFNDGGGLSEGNRNEEDILENLSRKHKEFKNEALRLKKASKLRKTAYNDLLSLIMESYPEPKRKLLETIGIE